MSKVIVDGFGGDNAPAEVLKGCRMAMDELGAGILLVGDEGKLRAAAQETGVSLEGMELLHAPDVLTMEDDPTDIRRAKRESSMAVGLRALAEGKGDAFVSGGNTGALAVGATLYVKRMAGVKRAALATAVPCDGGCYLLLDAGANAECRPEMLAQFGVMGSVYMERVMGIQKPRVGLVNVGAEEHKGGETQRAAYQLLKEAPVHFVGNVEARDIPAGAADVCVCDGFTGNVVLKLTEGLAQSLMGKVKGLFLASPVTKLAALALRGGIRELKTQMDYSEYGGAPLMGIARPVIKAHGSSNAKAFKNAIRQAVTFVESGANGEMERQLAQTAAE